MTSDEIIATPAPADRPSFTIRVGGAQISQEYQVRSIVVDRAFNRIASAEVTIFDGDPATQTFDVSDAADFVPGNEIEILAGYHGSEEVVFSGIVVRHGLQASGARPSVLRVECRDAAFTLTVGRKTAYFYDETDADYPTGYTQTEGTDPTTTTAVAGGRRGHFLPGVPSNFFSRSVQQSM